MTSRLHTYQVQVCSCQHSIQRHPDILLQGVYGAGAHTDYGLLTVLATDENPGLQIYTEGKWAHVKPVPATFVINLGDMLERCAAAAAVAANGLCDCSCFLDCSIVACTLHLHARDLSTAWQVTHKKTEAMPSVPCSSRT